MRPAWSLVTAALVLLTHSRALAQSSIPPTAANVAPPPNNAIMDPYLFVFVLLGGGLISLIAAVVTNNAVLTGPTAEPASGADALPQAR